MKKTLLIAVAAVALAAITSSIGVLADAPHIWRKTEEINEVTPALVDNEGSEFVHQVQWGEVDGWDEASWESDADILSPSDYVSVTETLTWVYANYGGDNLQTDEVNYEAADAWANPEQTLNQGNGDSEDLAFLLASLLKWHTDEVESDDLVFVNLGFMSPVPFADYPGPRAAVLWFDRSAGEAYQMWPALNSDLVLFTLPGTFGTLWLNDEYVAGFLQGYYPGPLPAVGSVGGYDRHDFAPIAARGFGDPMNSYPWSMAMFRGDLYVGTARNVPWQLTKPFENILGTPFEHQPITSPDSDPFSPEWARDMAGEIWRYGSPERVYRSPVLRGTVDMTGTIGSYPRESGFRQMTVFEGELYAASGGYSPQSQNLLLKSTNGTRWEPVDTPLEMGTDSRSMAVHNGRLYVGIGLGGLLTGKAEVWAYPSASGNWEQVADFSTVAPYTNTAVVSLQSFNGHLYAGTQNFQHGYQVFRSDVENPTETAHWEQLIDDGGGDEMNYLAGTMAVFKDHLYVGSMSWPLTDSESEPQPTMPKGFELIRIGPDAAPGEYELLVGDWFNRMPGDAQEVRPPLSGWPGGFGNFLNLYCWSLEVDDGVLYLGTFDASSFLHHIPVSDLLEREELDGFVAYLFDEFVAYVENNQDGVIAMLENAIQFLEEYGLEEQYIQPYRDLLAALQVETIDWDEVWRAFTGGFAGADLWKTEDGVVWKPVTLNGFGDPNNYGVRNMVEANRLYVGLANPFEGLQISEAPRPATVGGQTIPWHQGRMLVWGMGLAAPAALVSIATVVLVRRRSR